MSEKYDEYIRNHKANVLKGFEWIQKNIPEVLNEDTDYLNQIKYHDSSKYCEDEYKAYDNYFYSDDKSEKTINEFNVAWLKHIHRNPHHWQHWILNNDDPSEGEILIEIPHQYIIEMICDWWAFSWNKGDLYEIFKWYDAHKNYIKLNPKSKETIENILATIKKKLDELK